MDSDEYLNSVLGVIVHEYYPLAHKAAMNTPLQASMRLHACE
jgi:hypothetical protein